MSKHSATHFLIIIAAATAAAVTQSPELDKLFAAGSYSKAESVTISSPGRRHDLPPVHLQYLTLRGLAELPVLMLETAGWGYKADYYGRKHFMEEIKPSLPYGRVPVIQDFGPNGGILAQSSSIVRYLGDRSSLGGHDSETRALVDSAYETYKELFKSHSRWGQPFKVDALKEGIADDKSCEGSIDFKKSTNGGEYTDFEKSCIALRTFEDILAQNEKADPGFKNHLVRGVDPSYADLALLLTLLDLGEEDAIPDWSAKLRLPKLQALEAHLLRNELVADYLRSDRRMPRIKKIDGDYVFFKDRLSPYTGATRGDEL